MCFFNVFCPSFTGSLTIVASKLLLLLLLLLCDFSTLVLTGCFFLKSEWLQVSSGPQDYFKTFLILLFDFTFCEWFKCFFWGFFTEVWVIASTLDFLLISSFHNIFSRPLGTVPSTPTATDITMTFMHYWFFSSLAKSRYLPRLHIYSLFGPLKRQNPLHNKFFSC